MNTENCLPERIVNDVLSITLPCVPVIITFTFAVVVDGLTIAMALELEELGPTFTGIAAFLVGIAGASWACENPAKDWLLNVSVAINPTELVLTGVTTTNPERRSWPNAVVKQPQSNTLKAAKVHRRMDGVLLKNSLQTHSLPDRGVALRQPSTHFVE